MKTRTLLSLAAALIALPAAAQVEPSILGDNHAMVRPATEKHIVLLPVEEKEEMAHIRVIRDNELSQTMNIRLAVDKVDYYVPFNLRGGELFDITFDGDRRQKGSIKGFTCWEKMTYTDKFDDTNVEKHRPLYHHSPAYGWMNDPNGMFYLNGEWHLCYQWNPYASYWENLSWGQSTSRDLIHWEAQPAPMINDALGMIFSGSAVVDKDNTAGFGKNAVIAYYTSAGQSQKQCMAVSTDGGKTFKKYANNPVITAPVPDFRDPKVFWNDDAKFWNLILAAGQEMWIYSSKNLKDWTRESAFGREYGNHDGVWECPDLMKMTVCGTQETKWLLICNINPGGPAGGSATQYFVGDFDGHKFTCDTKPTVTKWMDYGKDHYATVTFDNAPEGRHSAIAWMSNWQYANQVPTLQYRAANSLVRDLGLFRYEGETYCSVTPAKEYDTMRGKVVKQPTEACEIVATVRGTATLTLTNTKGERVTMTYNADRQQFSMNREKSGNVAFSDAFPATTVAPTYGQVKQLRIFIDRSSIEVFSDGGRMAMTNLVFPTEPYNKLTVSGKAKARVYKLNY